MDFLPDRLPFTVPADPPVGPDLAADVVWFDTLVTNVDRTHRNPNLLVWGKRTWLAIRTGPGVPGIDITYC